jgi:predicted O-methyltransferase YrrM
MNICSKIKYRLIDIWDKICYQGSYDLDRIKKEEQKKFDEIGFNYFSSFKKLDGILRELGYPDIASYRGTLSVHWLLFCSLSLHSSIENILEIGTCDGRTAAFLAKVFPNSHITTLDLPENDPIFSETYNREDEDKRRIFREKQKKNISNPRITFIQKNSFFLSSVVDRKFDLIWIDGGHLYPDVAWDICNAYYLCKPGGWIMCDDVIMDKNGRRNKYVSPDSYTVLEYMKQRIDVDMTYFLKREAPASSANPRKRKYVAMFRKKR